MPQYRKPLAVALLLGLAASAAHAGHPPEPGPLVADLAPGSQERGSAPDGLVPFGDGVLFVAEDPQHGRELWTSDGTPRGTRRVGDVCPGPCPGVAGHPVVAGERYFFAVLETPGRFALWVGDAAGVRRVFLFPATLPPNFYNLTALGDRLVFVASDGEHGAEPWVSDGTPAGTRMLADLCLGGCSSDPADLAVVDETLFFRAHHTDLGQELFQTDGTPEGTGLTADICPGRCDSFSSHLFPWRGRIWFLATRPDVGLELWSAAPGAGARLEVDLLPGPESSVPRPQIVWRDRLYLQADSDEGLAWFRVSEPGEGAEPAVELDLGSGHVHSFTEVAGALHLLESSITGTRLWVLDGPSAPARRLASFDNGAVSPLGAVGGSVFYAHLSLAGETALWRTDGTVEGTRKLRRFERLPWSRGAAVGDRLLFAADGGGAGLELWAAEAAAAPRRVRNLAHDVASSAPHHLTAWGEDLAFLAAGADEPSGSVWRARGREVTRLSDQDDFVDLEVLGEDLIAARDGELWRIRPDGQALQIHDGQRPSELVVSGAGIFDDSHLYFGTFGQGQELWSTTGLPASTRLVIDLDPSWSDECPILCPYGGTYPRELTATGNGVAFVAAPGGQEAVYVSDGTAEGTVALAGGAPWAADGPFGFQDLRFVGRSLFFIGIHQPEEVFIPIRILYRWRQGMAVPERVADLAVPWLVPPRLAVAGGRLFFVRQAPEDGVDELWVVGPRSRPRRVVRFDSTADPPTVRELEPFADGVLVSVLDPAGGDEPWVSRGRPLATVALGDLAPGGASSRPTGIAEVGECGLFAAAGAGRGHELWLTDGTPEKTLLVLDLGRGASGSSPAEITPAGGLVYFSADDGTHGRELFAVERALVDEVCSSPPIAF